MSWYDWNIAEVGVTFQSSISHNIEIKNTRICLLWEVLS
jgi:hypothetical protein